MAEFETEHFRIIKEAMEGKHAVDEQALVSLAVLEERLGRLKKLDKIFDEVEFSSAVKKILSGKKALTVC
jgi:hypothetical protein